MNTNTIIRMRAGLGSFTALLLQFLFLVPFDRRPAWTLLGFLALGVLSGLLGLFAFPGDRALWRRWRQSLASPPMLFALAFIAYGAARWSAMLIPYAGRVWVMSTAWLAIGLALGSMLGVLDRAAAPAPPRAFTAFLSITFAAGSLVALVRLLTPFQHLPLPSPALLAPGLPDPAGRVYWPLFFDHIIWGAGPGALDLFIGNRPSLSAAAVATQAWRWRIPAELGVIGVGLAAAFLIAFLKMWPARAAASPASAQRLAIALTLLALALAAFAPGLGRPEAMALLGTLAGLAIGLDPAERRLRAYAGRLVAAVGALFVIGALALAMTARNQLAWRWHLRGDMLMSRGQWPAAIDFYEKAHAWQPDNPEHWESQARAYARIPDLVGNTSPYLVRAGDLDPYRAQVPAELARWMAERRRWAEAEVEMSRAFALDPTNKEYQREIARYKVRAAYLPPKPK